MDYFPSNEPLSNRSDTVTIGRIINIDKRNRNFSVIINNDSNNIIRFNLADNVRIFDPFGRRINFCRLFPGLRVRIRHANFMTRSIPPQTTAYTVRVIR